MSSCLIVLLCFFAGFELLLFSVYGLGLNLMA